MSSYDRQARACGPPSRLRLRHLAAGAAAGSLAVMGACNAGDLLAPTGADGTTPTETPAAKPSAPRGSRPSPPPAHHAPATPQHGGGGTMSSEEPVT